MKSQLSVIVPVYNVEKYLPTCIESILNQSFSEIELILVDDGSKDLSGKICDDYALKDSRVKVYHVENSGAAEARNVGLENSTSAYITFIDSDDYVPQDYLQTLMEELGDFDLLVAEHIKCKREEIEGIHLSPFHQRIEIRSAKEFQDLFPLVDTGYLGQPYSKVFSKSVIDENHIRFRKIQSEDEIFVFDYLKYVVRIKKIDYKGYRYIQNDNSLSQRHTTLTEMNWINIMVELYYKLDSKYHIFNDKDYFDRIKSRMLERYYWFLLKGYYHDTYVPKEVRMKRWDMVNKDDLFQKTSIGVIIQRMKNKHAMMICMIAKFGLWLFVDPILLKHMKRKN